MAGPPPTAPIDAPAPSLGPAGLGAAYEAGLDPAARAAGAHYTPPDVAARLVAVAAPPSFLRDRPVRVLDAACGGGALLLAAADALLASGHRAGDIVQDLLFGLDVDPEAVAVTRAALSWWADLHGAPGASPGSHLAVADALLDDPPGDPGHPLAIASGPGFDLVVGNPPFQGQLAGTAIRTPAATAALRARWGADVVGPYTDTSSLFLVAGARSLAPGGRLVLVLPTSVLAARDAAGARAEAAAVAPVVGLWVAAEPVFDAAVQVCAAVLERAVVERGPRERPLLDRPAADRADRPVVGRPDAAGELAVPAASQQQPAPAPIARWRGRSFEPLPPVDGRTVAGAAAGGSWAAWSLAALGVPDPEAASSGVLGSIASARAGFRDEYYGLVDHVSEGPDGAHAADLPAHLSPLITSGLIDPGWCGWGAVPVRFARQRFERPVVDRRSLAAAGGRAADWAAAVAAPKVVVATQTRVGEAAVDAGGRWVPSTPTIAVLAPPDRLWEVAAVVCSPVGTVAALAATAGTGRAGDAIKHSVASVLALPLPVDQEAWRAGAEALRLRRLDDFVDAMAAAHRVVEPAELHRWWRARARWPGGDG